MVFVNAAWAAPPDVASADALYNLARDHMSKGDYALAIAELRQSQSLDPEVGTALNLAECEEHLGRIATAWHDWLAAAAAAAAKGEDERKEFATERARLLEPRLLRATITIAPQAAREGIRVSIDQAPLPPNQWGVPIALDPGVHELVASADGFRPWRGQLTVAKGPDAVVVVPALASVAPEADASSTKSRGSPWPAVMWTTGAVGVAALGVGGAFGIAWLVNKNAADQNCPSSGCGQTGSADRARANDDGLVADVLFAAGGAAVLAALTLYIVLPSSPTQAPRGAWTAGMGATAGGATTYLARTW